MIRFLHTRIRVKDIEASIAFYLKLGYTEGVRKASPQGNQLAFLEAFSFLGWGARLPSELLAVVTVVAAPSAFLAPLARNNSWRLANT